MSDLTQIFSKFSDNISDPQTGWHYKYLYMKYLPWLHWQMLLLAFPGWAFLWALWCLRLQKTMSLRWNNLGITLTFGLLPWLSQIELVLGWKRDLALDLIRSTIINYDAHHNIGYLSNSNNDFDQIVINDDFEQIVIMSSLWCRMILIE